MKSLVGTRTEESLAKAFALESFARNKYSFFANKARKEGYEAIANVYLETERNEREHAKKIIKLIGSKGRDVNFCMGLPTFMIGATLENLKSSAEIEKAAARESYPSYAEIAEQEGFEEIAKMFRDLSSIELQHETIFRSLAEALESGTLFRRSRVVRWRCRNCGFIIEAAEAPLTCPVCNHPQGWFEEYQ